MCFEDGTREREKDAEMEGVGLLYFWLQGLLEAGLIRCKWNPSRLEISGVFYKNLLLSFCNLKYGTSNNKYSNPTYHPSR